MEIRDLAPAAADFPRDGKDNPVVVPKGGGKPVALTRTTTFIDCVEDKSTLSNWGKRMVLLGVAADPAILEEIPDLDPESTKYTAAVTALTERALRAAGAKDKAEMGTHLHALSELVDAGIPLPESASEGDRLLMAEYALLTMDFEHSHIEQRVVVPELGAAGTFDRRSTYSGPGPEGDPFNGPIVTDLKTGNMEYGWLKMAAQLGAYSRGELYDPTVCPAPPYHRQVTKKDDPEGFAAHKAWKAWLNTEFSAEEAAKAYSPLPPVSQDWGAIFSLPSGGEPASLFWVDLQVGWKLATLAKTIREARSWRTRALRPF